MLQPRNGVLLLAFCALVGCARSSDDTGRIVSRSPEVNASISTPCDFLSSEALAHFRQPLTTSTVFSPPVPAKPRNGACVWRHGVGPESPEVMASVACLNDSSDASFEGKIDHSESATNTPVSGLGERAVRTEFAFDRENANSDATVEVSMKLGTASASVYLPTREQERVLEDLARDMLSRLDREQLELDCKAAGK